MTSCWEIDVTFCLFIQLVQHTPLEQLDKKHFAKGSRRPEKNGGAAGSKEVDNSKEIALMEAKLKKLTDSLNEVSCWCTVTKYLFNILIINTLRFKI